MKKLIFGLGLSLICQFAVAQGITAADWSSLKQKEDSLKLYAARIIQGINPDDRLKADSTFTRILMRALKTNRSFQFPFDSLYTISRLYAPDSSFRIFTWQLVINDNVIRQHGAIQMNTPDGSLKRFPLIDKSDVTVSIEDTVGDHMGWIGAVYYKIIQTRRGNQQVYTLLGYDEYNIRANRKIMEVLTFVNGEPVFGGNYFNMNQTLLSSRSPISRYVMEYKKDAGPRLSFDPELGLVIAEHLVSESGEPNRKWTLVGDGDYEGFKWQDGAWLHINKVFNQVTPEGKEPVPNPLRDNGGDIKENKLIEVEEQKPATETKPKTVKKGVKGGGE
ncbi:MAG: hypothetical protein IPP31_11060 [Chitinophagaceae bacterium]|nr:hypothetical protein [Chitinophagaceae bacterium]